MPHIKCDECDEHSGLEARVARDTEDIQRLWKAIEKMRAWVVAGMGSMIGYVLILVINRVFQ